MAGGRVDTSSWQDGWGVGTTKLQLWEEVNSATGAGGSTTRRGAAGGGVEGGGGAKGGLGRGVEDEPELPATVGAGLGAAIGGDGGE